MCQILSLSQGTKNHVWVLNQQGLASVHGSNICFLQQFQKQTKQNKTTLCASEKKFLFPSDYLLAVAPHNTTNSMIILYPLAPFIIYDHSAPTVNQPKDQLNQFFRPFNTGKIPGLVKVAIAQCQEFFGGKWVREDKGESVQSECCSLCAIYIPRKQTTKTVLLFLLKGNIKQFLKECQTKYYVIQTTQKKETNIFFFRDILCFAQSDNNNAAKALTVWIGDKVSYFIFSLCCLIIVRIKFYSCFCCPLYGFPFLFCMHIPKKIQR